MRLEELRKRVFQANRDLVDLGLATLTWGNVSGLDRESGIVVIKPSGVDNEELAPETMVLVDLEGNRVEGDLNPSSDTPTHLELYRSFAGITGVAHTHSDYAGMFAQAHRDIPCMGTTHADHFNGAVPLTRMITQDEVEADYEGNTGKVIVERFERIDPLEIPAVLVAAHGPFTWGRSPEEAVVNSLALEKTAKLAWGALSLNPEVRPFPEYLLRKHYGRKHGPLAYYGQKTGENT
ncbi:MAG: L-ribulose-5-phosphate 4-epimerase AraD [Candidatus Aminicenantaceae bacterium]